MYCTSTIFLAEYKPPVDTMLSPGVGSTFIDALSLVLFCLTEATSNSSLPSFGKAEIDATGDCACPAGVSRIPIVTGSVIAPNAATKSNRPLQESCLGSVGKAIVSSSQNIARNSGHTC